MHPGYWKLWRPIVPARERASASGDPAAAVYTITLRSKPCTASASQSSVIVPISGWWKLFRRSVHGRPRRDDRERRAAVYPARPAVWSVEPAMGDQHVHAD